MALLYRITLNRPLTNNELDGNFDYLNTEVEARYKTEDFTAANIAGQLRITTGEQTAEQLVEANNLNSWLLRNLEPSSTTPTITNKESVVVRDSLGDFAANNITANLLGNADTATEADHAASAADLDAEFLLSVYKGGTAARTVAGARTSLAVLGIAGTEEMTGTLKLATSLIGQPSLRFGIGADVTSGSNNGDVWFTSTGIRYKIDGFTETVAKIKSPTFTGVPQAPNASDVASQIATIDHVEASKKSLYSTNAAYIAGGEYLNLKANIASPTFTGTPKSVTPGSADGSTAIATTAFVQTVAASKADGALSDAKDYTDAVNTDAGTALSDGLGLKANIDSPTLTGTPKSTTPTDNTTTTRIATTGYVVTHVSNSLANYQTTSSASTDRDKWGSSRKFVQTTIPVGAQDGDFWFKV